MSRPRYAHTTYHCHARQGVCVPSFQAAIHTDGIQVASMHNNGRHPALMCCPNLCKLQGDACDVHSHVKTQMLWILEDLCDLSKCKRCRMNNA